VIATRAARRQRAIALAEQERAEQGLPPRIEDVSVLSRVATIMRLADRDLPVERIDRRRRRRKP